MLIPRAPLADLPVVPTPGCGVIAGDRDGLGLATILVRKGKSIALAQRMREHFGIELPPGPRRATAGGLALAGTGPGAWLATFEQGGNTFVVHLREKIGDLASVSDQSDGYAVLRLAGPKVRETLCKLIPIDVHPRAFKVDDVVVSVAAHIAATLWRVEDQVDDSPAFEIAVLRSFVTSFWQALSESAAEFGFNVKQFDLSVARRNGPHLCGWRTDAATKIGDFGT